LIWSLFTPFLNKSAQKKLVPASTLPSQLSSGLSVENISSLSEKTPLQWTNFHLQGSPSQLQFLTTFW
jgi:hypothetical protein